MVPDLMERFKKGKNDKDVQADDIDIEADFE